MYEADELSTAEPIMLINLNRLYRRDMTVVDGEIYKPLYTSANRGPCAKSSSSAMTPCPCWQIQRVPTGWEPAAQHQTWCKMSITRAC